MKHVITAVLLALLASTTLAAVQIATASAAPVCIPPAVAQVLS
ncbi:MAG TPA: hypothetical protein VN929_12495 [Burkholderiales bacterium]|nr:hypothetical protein [Burkholderiales bacterium]